MNNAPKQASAAPDEGEAGAGTRRITCLSAPQGVSMGDEWFEMADLEHFWMIRRFEVLRKLCGQELHSKLNCAEVGCGQGVLQRQLEIGFGLKVDGFDLHLKALKRNVSTRGDLYYYDVHDRHPQFAGTYDALFLFDVLEHIDRDDAFLQACLFHLKPEGVLVVNIPARRELFSRYDTFAGHVRRYTLGEVIRLAEKLSLKVGACTYWGLPLYPILFLRKLLMKSYDESSAFRKGFVPPNRWADSFLKAISRLEFIPQRLLGTSLMAVYHR